VGTAAGADALAALRKRIAPFILRRHKMDPGIADELPERIIVRDDCTLTREQAALYQAVVKDMTSDVADVAGMARRGRVLAGITKLKQICNHPATIGRFDPEPLAVARASSTGWSRCPRRSSKRAKRSSCSASTPRSCAGSRPSPHELGSRSRTSTARWPAARTRRSSASAPTAGRPCCASLKAGGTGLNLVREPRHHFDRW
jgi:hypothetical protein